MDNIKYYIHESIKPPKRSGLYSLTFDNGKRYIGKAKSFFDRFSKHKCQLKNNNHFNKHLQRTYNKDPEALYFEIIEIVEHAD